MIRYQSTFHLQISCSEGEERAREGGRVREGAGLGVWLGGGGGGGRGGA